MEKLQRLILSLFTDWHSQRGENEKKVLKTIGCLNENYSYEEMIRCIGQYERTYSTDDKLNDYLFKVLGGVQKLKRTIYPDLCVGKLDPISTLDKIEKWIKMRIELPIPQKKMAPNEDKYLTNDSSTVRN